VKRIAFILSWLCIIINGFAQTPTVGVGPAGITGLPDEVYVNQTVSFRVNVQNKGVVDINGWLDVYAGTMQGQQVAIIGAQSVFVDTNLFVSGDTVSVELMFPVDTGTAQLSMGGNTVVVWPAAFGAITSDSIFKQIDIVLPPDTIGFDPNFQTTFPDSVAYGEVDSIIFYIHNKRKSPYEGTVNLWHQVISDSTGTITTRIDSSTLNNIILNAEESRRVAMPQTFNNPQYRMGGNTVVVWPANINMETADTATGRIILAVITSIDKPIWIGHESVQVFPNPTQDFIQVKHSEGLSIKSIVITNELGQLVLKTNHSKVDISNYKNGVYLVTIDFGEEKQRSYKLLKQ